MEKALDLENPPSGLQRRMYESMGNSWEIVRGLCEFGAVHEPIRVSAAITRKLQKKTNE